jgi:hypothetical protein
MLLHETVSHGALMEQPVLLRHDFWPKGKPHGARPLHGGVFPWHSHGATRHRGATLCYALRSRLGLPKRGAFALMATAMDVSHTTIGRDVVQDAPSNSGKPNKNNDSVVQSAPISGAASANLTKRRGVFPWHSHLRSWRTGPGAPAAGLNLKGTPSPPYPFLGSRASISHRGTSKKRWGFFITSAENSAEKVN